MWLRNNFPISGYFSIRCNSKFGLNAVSTAEAIQNEVFATGKDHGSENLRDWFKSLYQTLLCQDQGPRFGSFVALYGIEPTRKLIAQALRGELAK